MIKIKPKPCKSVHSRTRGHGCGKVILNRTFGLCRMCYIDWLLKTEEGQIYLEKSKLKGKKKALIDKERRERAKFKKMKAEVTDWKKLLQNKINELARLIDSGLPCLATQKHAKQIHGGHVLSRGSQPSIRYNLHNIHRQSAQSNHWQQDDIKMREGLAREYGQGYLDFLLSLKQIRPLKFTKQQYRAFYQIACDLVNELRKDGKTFNTPLERIEARNYYNIKIGMYYLKHSKYNETE